MFTSTQYFPDILFLLNNYLQLSFLLEAPGEALAKITARSSQRKSIVMVIWQRRDGIEHISITLHIFYFELTIDEV